MMGDRRPAALATLTKWASNGRPEGLPRGTALTPREAMPRGCGDWAREEAKARSGRPRACRRVIGLAGCLRRSGLGGGHRAFVFREILRRSIRYLDHGLRARSRLGRR